MRPVGKIQTIHANYHLADHLKENICRCGSWPSRGVADGHHPGGGGQASGLPLSWHKRPTTDMAWGEWVTDRAGGGPEGGRESLDQVLGQE